MSWARRAGAVALVLALGTAVALVLAEARCTSPSSAADRERHEPPHAPRHVLHLGACRDAAGPVLGWTRLSPPRVVEA